MKVKMIPINKHLVYEKAIENLKLSTEFLD